MFTLRAPDGRNYSERQTILYTEEGLSAKYQTDFLLLWTIVYIQTGLSVNSNICFYLI